MSCRERNKSLNIKIGRILEIDGKRNFSYSHQRCFDLRTDYLSFGDHDSWHRLSCDKPKYKMILL